MAFGLRRRGCPRDEIARRVAWAAELLGLDGLLDRRPHTLSGGQRQRVALGRAVVRRPKLFLFDEPLSNLDARLRTDTRAELKRLHRKLATTTLYVTHDQEEAMTLAERIAVLRGGRIQQCGTPLEVYNAPGQPLRRRLHRHAGDELHRRPLAAGRRRPDVVRVALPASPRRRKRTVLRRRHVAMAGLSSPAARASRSASGPTTSNCGPRPATASQAPGASPARSRWSSRWAARWTCTSRRRAERGSSAAPRRPNPVQPAGEPLASIRRRFTSLRRTAEADHLGDEMAVAGLLELTAVDRQAVFCWLPGAVLIVLRHARHGDRVAALGVGHHRAGSTPSCTAPGPGPVRGSRPTPRPRSIFLPDSAAMRPRMPVIAALAQRSVSLYGLSWRMASNSRSCSFW